MLKFFSSRLWKSMLFGRNLGKVMRNRQKSKAENANHTYCTTVVSHREHLGVFPSSIDFSFF
jgi:hypothetical protein